MAGKYMLVFLALLVEHLSFGGKPPSCPPCSKAFCVQSKNCKGGRVMDTCGCCLVCAKAEGELCGGKWMIEGKCDKKLKCVTRDRHHRSPWPNIGHCEPVACANKKCGFRQECTLNKRGHPHCVCPRNCRNRPVIPVCGYSNGKQYNNDCELYRHECKSRRAITLMHGPCKKCIYKGRKYKFDDVRPGDSSCELCVCRHGEWTCRMKKNCRVRSCNHEVRGRDGRVTSPCPPGFTCKIQIPGIPEQDIPAVAECVPLIFTKTPAKVTRKRPGFNRPAHCLLQNKRGPCLNKIIRWYYNPHRGKCVKFTYGGCGGNLNRFVTKSSCRTICKKGPNSRKPAIVSTITPKTEMIINPKICLQPRRVGPCRAFFERWYYDSAEGRCLKFIYGGCGSNHNNFATEKECETACPGVRKQVTVTHATYTTTEKKEVTQATYTTTEKKEVTTAFPRTPAKQADKNDVGGLFSCYCNTCSGELTKNKCVTSFGCFASVTLHLDGRQEKLYGCVDSYIHYMLQCSPIQAHSVKVNCCRSNMCNQAMLKGDQMFFTQGLVADEPQPTTRASLATVVKMTPHTTAPSSEVCFDRHSMKSYGEGEEWKPNDCTVCKCRGGQPMCVATVCRHPNCRHPVRVEGLCCPKCPRNESVFSLEADEGVQALAGKKPETILVTINKAEERGVCEEEESGELYLLGQTWKPDDCTLCECGRDGRVSCAVQSCEGQIPNCERPVREKGQCCPVCKKDKDNEVGVLCRDSKTGSFYRPGEMWQSDECTMCTCENNGIPHAICSRDKCKATSCPNPVRVKGRCCEVCPERVEQGCIFEGKKFLNGDFRLLADYCTLCECREGEWRCTSDKCHNSVQRS